MRMAALRKSRPMTPRINEIQNAVVLVALIFLCAPTLGSADVDEPQSGEDGGKRKPLFTVIPDYPKVARRDRIEGDVQVCFDVTRDGRTRRIGVRKSTHRVFEKAAIRAVRASTYVPLPSDAVITGIKACRTFRFTLEPVVTETES